MREEGECKEYNQCSIERRKRCGQHPPESSDYPWTHKPRSHPHTRADTQAGLLPVWPKPSGSEPLQWQPLSPDFTVTACSGSLSNQARKCQPRPDAPEPPHNGPFLVCLERFELWLLLSSIPQQFSEAHPAREHSQGWQWLKGKV